jgi:plexin A
MTLFFFATIVTFSYVSSLPVFSEDISGKKPLERLIVHPQTGDVYVAAVNRLYQLTSDLQPKGQEYKTGPKHTDGQCFPPEWKRPSQSDSLFCSSKDDLVDFHNQVFLLNLTGSVITDTVIVCGNAYSGECNFHSAENISSITISSKNIFDDANKLNRPILASQYQTLSTSAVTSTLQNNEAALFVASVTPSSTVLTHSVMKVVKLNATDVLAVLGEQALARWNEKGSTDRPRQGFKSGQFVYFASYQMVTRDSTSKYMTVLSRICTNDLGLGDDPPTILAYMEGSIKCGNFDYMTSQTVVRPGTMLQTALQLNAMEDILIASFAQDYNSGLDSVSGKSAICIFKMSEIEQQFKNTQESCRLGDATVKKGLQREGTNNGACIDISSVWDGKSCSPTNKVNFVLEVMTPITSQSVYNLTSGQITTVAATVVGKTTVLFVGINNGNIIKLQLDSRISVVELSNSPVLELTSKEILSMSFSYDNDSLLIMSESEVVKFPTHTCDLLTSCDECVMSSDPHCGFCTLENKCSSEDDCQESTDPQRWLQSNSSQCIKVLPIGRLIASVATPKQISLQVLNVPMIGSFECVFGEQGSTVATRSGTGQSTFSCQTPQPSSLPGLGDSLTVSVSLKSTSTGVHFVRDITTLTLFDCNVHRTCSACTAAALPCGWCLFNSNCTDSSNDCRAHRHWKEDVGLCPKLRGDEIFWPSGVAGFNFSVYGENLPQPERGDIYECNVDVPGGQTFTVPARRLSASQLECLPSSDEVFSYNVQNEVQSATLNVKWTASGASGTMGFLEKEDGFSLTLFKCEVSANDCSECLSVDRKAVVRRRKCGWCNDIPKDAFTCTVELECPADWIDPDVKSDSSCPEPVITDFSPKKGPRDGGTNVTIEGSNLGVQLADISSVTAGGVACDLISERYAPGKTIVCMTRESNSVVSGEIKVNISKETVSSDEVFAYVDVQVTGYRPTKGPAAGGTKITVYGDHLDSGTEVKVTLAGIDCTVKERTKVDLVCLTQAFNLSSRFQRSLNSTEPQVSMLGDLQVSIDKARPTDNGGQQLEQFLYTPNPTVINITPKRGLAAGGIPINVTGDWLDSVQQPLIVLSDENNNMKFPCQRATNRKEMTCYQPSYPNQVPEGRNVKVNVTFIMDSVPRASLQLKELFSIWPDPVFERFTEPRVFKEDEDQIILRGRNLDVVDAKYYEVRLGDSKWCNVTNLATDVLLCRPDKGKGGEAFPIIVRIGNFSSGDLGLIEYSTDSSGLNPVIVAVPIAVIAFVAVLAIIAIVLIARHRSIKREAHVQKLLVQMDRLEATVAKECKQGFAELQTDLDDWEQALTGDHLPMLPFRQYAMRVLFPRDEDHAVLHPLSQKLKNRPKLANEKVRQGTDLFLAMIRNKSFLVKFIQTMESDNTFTMKDRTEVASLLMVVCQDKMDYATDILKRLLSILIRRSIGKSHPKLLLRRTESVAEKLLTNWLAFCLHQHVQDVVGKPLYTLFRAVKSQIEKGPVDAITGESRYALSEDKLLRHQVDYHEMKFTVVDASVGNVPVKLLDVDTISQAKDKIVDAMYKTAGVSQRPNISSVDLGLLPHGGTSQPGLKFRDEDMTTVVEGEWKQVNTIKHYNVPEGSLLQLTPRNTSVVNGRSTDHTQMLIASPSRSLIIEEEGGAKVWHLTKQTDTATLGGDHKLVSEIYLTRMLSTKRIVQKFVDDLFDAIFPPARDAPFPVKYLFNFLDNEAAELNITDRDILHAWKTNSVPLRFWINVIKNPDFVFDITKSTSVDSCLSVIAQTFMDGCSIADHKLSKDSPSSKLLYNKEVQQYKQRIQRYYSELQSLPRISEGDMARYMREVTQAHGEEFDQRSALYELYQFAYKYRNQIAEELVVDASLAKDFQRVLDFMRL